ncbi:MAG: SUMF1/EgtB/PvdO family nonheme iron enzyme [Paraclostridium sp.]
MQLQSINKLLISSDCIACGICFLCTDYISEDREGKAFVKSGGIVENKDIKKISEVIENCPVKAISMKRLRLTDKNGKEGLEKLIQIIEGEFLNYKLPLPNPNLYRFKKEEYSIEIPYSREELRYEYKSYKKAEAEGLREFDRIMFSKRKILVQQILIQYKNRYFNQFIEYKELQGEYYYDIISNFKNRLDEFVAEIKILSPNIGIPEDFLEFNYKPIFGLEKGDKFDRERHVYLLKNLESSWITNDIIKDLEELKWYESYINWNDRTTYRGNKEVELYCYDLREAKEQLAKYIIDYSEFNLNNMMGAKEVLEQTLGLVMEKVILEIKNKVEILLNIIRNEINSNQNNGIDDNLGESQDKLKLEAKNLKKENIFKNKDMIHVLGGKYIPSFLAKEKRVDDIEVCRYQTTQKMWMEVMETNPSKFKGEKLPVENISWWDALEFCNRLSERHGLQSVYLIEGQEKNKKLKIKQLDGKVVCSNLADFSKTEGYRLPTEIEWEWFARGGQVAIERGTFDTNYSGSENIDEVAWYQNNSIRRTHEVGTKKSNELALYDCSGNISEWCYDTLTNSYDEKGSFKRALGGSWDCKDYCCEISDDAYYNNFDESNYRNSQIGFRIVKSVSSLNIINNKNNSPDWFDNFF